MASENAFQYTVERILEKRCVPFAGAGISTASSPPNGKRIHDVSVMVKELTKEILCLRLNRYKNKEHGPICVSCAKCVPARQGSKFDSTATSCFFCDVINAMKNAQLGCLSELYLWEFSSDCAHENLVRLLEIDRYPELRPTSAHKHIAKLAREGLINEVFTTNYDCSFEKAYNEASDFPQSEVISSLDAYRNRSAGAGSNLKIYKLNGCAKRLEEENFEKKYESILLTERQLQKWRNREWAADLFRDRLRSKSMLFVGFGSDEPQVHHTLQTVLDEYSNERGGPKCHPLQTMSAPIVASYSPHPSFHQQQIVNTYADLHCNDPDEGKNLIIRNPDLKSCLSADGLWEKIYERVMRELLIKAIKTSINAANASFTAILPFSVSILHQIVSSLETAKVDDNNLLTAAPAWLVKITSSEASPTCNYSPYATLINCLGHLFGKPLSYYEPLNKNKALISELAAFLFLLKDRVKLVFNHVPDTGLELYLVSSTENRIQNKKFYLNANPSNSAGHKKTDLSGRSGNLALSLSLGQAGSHAKPYLRRIANKNESTGSINPQTVVHLSWQHIFYRYPYEGNKDSVAKEISKAITSPSHYFYANQPSIRKRSYLKEVR